MKTKIHFNSCLILLFFFGITGGLKHDTLYAQQTNNAPLQDGLGEFVYTDYEPLKDRPITVYYYKPKNLPKDAPVMILMHGNSRAALNYRKSMVPYAEQYKFLLIVPKFSAELYPSIDYHQGGVFDKNGKMKERKDWTFSVIEPLFDYVVHKENKTNKGYILYGFSAGAQFVHRYSWFFPNNRALKTITASAGSYTMPDYNADYKYGLGSSKVSLENLKSVFGKDYTVVVGEDDSVLSRKDLPKDVLVSRQGRDRVERAMHFYLNAKQFANDKRDPFTWKFEMPEGVGHSQAEMAGPVARMLFDKEDKEN